MYHVDLLYILRSGVRSSFHKPKTCLVFTMAPGNVSCHRIKHLMGHFEFLHDSRMAYLLLNILEKLQ